MTTQLSSHAERRRFRRLDRMEPHMRVPAAQKFANSHDRATGADPCDESVDGPPPCGERMPDLGSGGEPVCFSIRDVRELPRQKDLRLFLRHILTALQASQEPTLFASNQLQACAKAAQQFLPFMTEPIWHEDRHRMPEG